MIDASDGLDFTPEESRIIGQMVKAERSMPDEFWHIAAMQELASVLARYQAVMSDADCAAVIGCGAMLVRHGKREMTAEIEMRMAIARAKEGPAT